MRHPRALRTRGFRCVLALALLAWTLLAFGVSASAHVTVTPVTAGVPVPTAPAPHCDGMALPAAVPDQAPVVPPAHGDCCHGACACPASCNVTVAVPAAMAAAALQHVAAYPDTAVMQTQASAPPPLRPPIS